MKKKLGADVLIERIPRGHSLEADITMKIERKEDIFKKPSMRGMGLNQIMLIIVALITCVSGWYYGFCFIIPSLLWYGIGFKKWVNYELLNNEFTGIRSNAISEVYYYKRRMLIRLILGIILMTIVGILYYFQILNLPNWANCCCIVLFTWLFTFWGSQYLAFYKFQKYLENFSDKEPEE